MMNSYHQSVLLESSINGLDIKPHGIYVDATFGGGGHSRMILKKLSEGKLFAFDMDNACLVNKIKNDDRFKIVKSNFKHMSENLLTEGVKLVDGIKKTIDWFIKNRKKFKDIDIKYQHKK